MENHITLEIIEQASPPETPSLIKYISSNELEDFDEFDSEFPSPNSKVRLLFKSFLLLLIKFKMPISF